MSTETNESLYQFQRISDDTLELLMPIAKSAFGIDLKMPMLRGMYDTSAFGVSHIGYVALDNRNDPAAFYGVFPLIVRLQGTFYLAAQSGSTMTHKQHQGKGLFVGLAKATYKLAAENNIHFVLGFPNQNSYPGFVKKLDWQHPENLVLFKCKVTTMPLADMAARYSFFDKMYRTFFAGSFKQRMFFESSVLKSGQDGINRNQDFWNYKSYNPNFTFVAGGLLVWAKVNGALFIGDIEKKEGTDYSLVIRDIKRKAKRLGCTKIISQCSSGSWLAEILTNDFERSEGLPFGFLPLLNNTPSPESLKFTMADFDTF